MTVSRYWLGASPVKVKLPSAAEVVVRSPSLPTGMSVTVAEEIGLPCLSRSVPATCAVPSGASGRSLAPLADAAAMGASDWPPT